jgi:tartrate-resistant acid phosphatase type 5
VVLILLGTAGPAKGATRILAVGDFGVGGRSQQATGDAMRRFEATHPASWLVTLGDNDYTESPSRFNDNWVDSFGWLEDAGVRVAGTLGNHDYAVGSGRHEFAELGMPGRFYTRRAGNVQLFLLDSNVIDRAQTRCLARRLGASTARWKVAVFHHARHGHAGTTRATSASSGGGCRSSSGTA